MRILTVNVGSTSVKLRVIGAGDEVVGRADLGAPSQLGPGELSSALARFAPVDAVGHRIVHGGTHFTGPVPVDDGVLKELRALTDLAPLHQPPALDVLDAVASIMPGLFTVACFDTAFHATLPVESYTYAVPQEWRDLGARKFGFHGLSHAWADRRAAQLAVLPAGARVVTCHLGGGASLAAIAGGRCVDTTMGFTPLDGLVMATRSGSVDPGLILWLQQHEAMTPGPIIDALEHRSGLVGLCGTDDLREVVRRAAGGAGDRSAVTALGVYVHRLRAGIAAMAAALGGIDALVFTGGVGEHCGPVREATCAGLGFLGVALARDPLDPATATSATDTSATDTSAAATSATSATDYQISRPGAAVRVLVIEAREDLEIARGVRQVIGDR